MPAADNICSLSSVNQDTTDRHDTFLNCKGYHSAWDFTQLIENKKFIHAHFYCFWWILFNIRTSSGRGEFIDFQMALCWSAIFFPLTASSLKISRFLEKKETLGCRQYQVLWDIGFVWCVVLVHVTSEMQVGVLTASWLSSCLSSASWKVSLPTRACTFPASSQPSLAQQEGVCWERPVGSMPTHQRLLSWISEVVSI